MRRILEHNYRPYEVEGRIFYGKQTESIRLKVLNRLIGRPLIYLEIFYLRNRRGGSDHFDQSLYDWLPARLEDISTMSITKLTPSEGGEITDYPFFFRLHRTWRKTYLVLQVYDSKTSKKFRDASIEDLRIDDNGKIVASIGLAGR